MSKRVKIGNIAIGGGEKVAIQSMLNVISTDIKGNVAQAQQLEAAGCEIIRASVPDKSAVELIYQLKNAVSVPIVADIHFDYRLALECVSAGVDKIRINPGNIGADDNVKAVANACAAAGVPIRIGVNSGSVEKHILAKYGKVTADALVESAQYHVSLLERFGFDDIVISIKSSDVQMMFDAYKKAAAIFDYPLHLGVTEACIIDRRSRKRGVRRKGYIKSGRTSRIWHKCRILSDLRQNKD